MTMPKSDNGIVILGVPRSGTTLVRRILNAHPNIASPGETCILSACARFLKTEIVADGVEFGVVNGLSFAGFEHDEILDRLRTFAFGFHDEYAREHGKKRWAEKTAVDIFHLNEIETLCGDQVQYVCVVRHGLDVVCSIQEFSDRGFTYLAELHEYVKKYPRALEAFAHAWVDANSALIDFVSRNPNNTLLIRYEDLISAPEDRITELFDFLNETYYDDILERAFKKPRSAGFGDWKTYSRKTIDNVSVQRWKSLPPNTVNRLAEICNPVLKQLGYKEEQTRTPDDQKVARRKYDFSVIVGSADD